MRRIMLLTLLAVVLPTAVLAIPMTLFETGTFESGTISRSAEGGLSPLDFSTIMVGSMDRIMLTGITLIPGSQSCTGITGTCTFTAGIVTVTTNTEPFTTIFTGPIDNGLVTKIHGGTDIVADVLPTFRGSSKGSVEYFAKFEESGDGILTGTRAEVSVPEVPIPEPGALGLLGTGVLGLAGMARRRFKLGS